MSRDILFFYLIKQIVMTERNEYLLKIMQMDFGDNEEFNNRKI